MRAVQGAAEEPVRREGYHRRQEIKKAEGTKRELEIMQLLADGHTMRTAATELGITYNTARTHVNHVLIRLNVHTATQAVAILMRTGLIK